MKSNTYRRNKQKTSLPRTRWEYVYGAIAAKLLRSGKYTVQNAFSTAKFLGAFVYVFSFPYSVVKVQWMKIKAKIK